MVRYGVLLLLILAWALPPLVTLFFVWRSRRQDGGLRGDRNSLRILGRRPVILIVAVYWLLCLTLSLALFLLTA